MCRARTIQHSPHGSMGVPLTVHVRSHTALRSTVLHPCSRACTSIASARLQAQKAAHEPSRSGSSALRSGHTKPSALYPSP